MITSLDEAHMARALQLAGRGLYTTDPNPRVGCVLAKEGAVLGEGWHELAGGPHAERMALERGGAECRGASAFVTLEPCSHTGRTGPCVDALIEAGIERVVCAGLDPDPRVSGAGVKRLEEAGVTVEVGMLERSATALNPGYISRMTRGRPLVRSKLAVSLDGGTALAGGESQWITGQAARADVHHWRARSSGVVTGIGTVLADDPSLNARLTDPGRVITQPARVVIDARLQTPPGAKLVSLPGDVIVFTTDAAGSNAQVLRDQGVVVEEVAGEERCDLAQVMQRLSELEFNELWVESGAGLNGALLEAGLLDELVIYVAPHLLGADARGMFSIEPLASLEQRVWVAYEDVRRFGDDLRIIACLAE